MYLYGNFIYILSFDKNLYGEIMKINEEKDNFPNNSIFLIMAHSPKV